ACVAGRPRQPALPIALQPGVEPAGGFGVLHSGDRRDRARQRARAPPFARSGGGRGLGRGGAAGGIATAPVRPRRGGGMLLPLWPCGPRRAVVGRAGARRCPRGASGSAPAAAAPRAGTGSAVSAPTLERGTATDELGIGLIGPGDHAEANLLPALR